MTRIGRLAVAILLIPLMPITAAAGVPPPTALEREFAVASVSSAQAMSFAKDVVLFQKSLDQARAFLLVGRCKGLKREEVSFRQRIVIEVAQALVAKQLLQLTDEKSQAALMRRLAEMFFLVSFTPEEALRFLQYIRTPAGQSVLRSLELEASILAAASRLTDVSSGQPWVWPVARLLTHLKSEGLDQTFLQAVDAVAPGSAKAVVAASPDPAAPIDEAGMRTLHDLDWEAVAAEFTARRAPALREAQAELDQFDFAHRRMQTASALSRLWTPDIIGRMPDWQDKAREACVEARGGPARGGPCAPETVVRLSRLAQAAFQADDHEALRQVAIRHPGAACPAR